MPLGAGMTHFDPFSLPYDPFTHTQQPCLQQWVPMGPTPSSSPCQHHTFLVLRGGSEEGRLVDLCKYSMTFLGICPCFAHLQGILHMHFFVHTPILPHTPILEETGLRFFFQDGQGRQGPIPLPAWWNPAPWEENQFPPLPHPLPQHL